MYEKEVEIERLNKELTETYDESRAKDMVIRNHRVREDVYKYRLGISKASLLQSDATNSDLTQTLQERDGQIAYYKDLVRENRVSAYEARVKLRETLVLKDVSSRLEARQSDDQVEAAQEEGLGALDKKKLDQQQELSELYSLLHDYKRLLETYRRNNTGHEVCTKELMRGNSIIQEQDKQIESLKGSLAGAAKEFDVIKRAVGDKTIWDSFRLLKTEREGRELAEAEALVLREELEHLQGQLSNGTNQEDAPQQTSDQQGKSRMSPTPTSEKVSAQYDEENVLELFAENSRLMHELHQARCQNPETSGKDKENANLRERLESTEQELLQLRNQLQNQSINPDLPRKKRRFTDLSQSSSNTGSSPTAHTDIISIKDQDTVAERNPSGSLQPYRDGNFGDALTIFSSQSIFDAESQAINGASTAEAISEQVAPAQGINGASKDQHGPHQTDLEIARYGKLLEEAAQFFGAQTDAVDQSTAPTIARNRPSEGSKVTANPSLPIAVGYQLLHPARFEPEPQVTSSPNQHQSPHKPSTRPVTPSVDSKTPKEVSNNAWPPSINSMAATPPAPGHTPDPSLEQPHPILRHHHTPALTINNTTASTAARRNDTNYRPPAPPLPNFLRGLVAADDHGAAARNQYNINPNTKARGAKTTSDGTAKGTTTKEIAVKSKSQALSSNSDNDPFHSQFDDVAQTKKGVGLQSDVEPTLMGSSTVTSPRLPTQQGVLTPHLTSQEVKPFSGSPSARATDLAPLLPENHTPSPAPSLSLRIVRSTPSEHHDHPATATREGVNMNEEGPGEAKKMLKPPKHVRDVNKHQRKAYYAGRAKALGQDMERIPKDGEAVPEADEAAHEMGTASPEMEADSHDKKPIPQAEQTTTQGAQAASQEEETIPQSKYGSSPRKDASPQNKHAVSHGTQTALQGQEADFSAEETVDKDDETATQDGEAASQGSKKKKRRRRQRRKGNDVEGQEGSQENA